MGGLLLIELKNALREIRIEKGEGLMRGQAFGKRALSFTLLAAGIIATLVFAQAQKKPVEKSQEVTYEEQRAVIDALRRAGLKGAAKIKGDYVQVVDPNPDWLSLDLEKLTLSSEAVILGVPVKNECKLAANNQLIVTEYDVVVKEVLKGNIQSGDTIKVALLGGKVKFEDGTTAEIVTPGFKKMVHGKTYALYLSLYPARSPVYDLTAGPQGMTELLDDGSGVISQARETDPVKKQLKGKDKETFLKEARKLSREWPQPGKCCN
ncbi:MAG: hypothetical protein ICV60_00505 [Pyrinomonadaceae bacterium]|nr:hypothetical protein [Pyrinomonadaceae bacterium]